MSNKPNTRCTACGKPIYRKPNQIVRGGNFYCSPECLSEGKAEQKAAREAARLPNTSCSYCGKRLFRYPSQIGESGLSYCGPRCQRRAQIEALEHPGPNTTCATCGKPIFRKPAVLKRSEIAYCNRACQAKGKAKQFAEARARKANTKCGYCGKPLYRSPSVLKQTAIFYCNIRCMGEAKRVGPNTNCHTCGKPVYRPPSHIESGTSTYCSPECAAQGRKKENQPNTRCFYCGKPLYRKPSMLRERNYCDIRCRAKGVARIFGTYQGKNFLEEDFHRAFPMLSFVGDGELWVQDDVGKMNPDFAVPETNKVIEVWGDHWHRGENEKNRIDRLAKAGYRAIVIWEHEFRNQFDRVEKYVKEFISC